MLRITSITLPALTLAQCALAQLAGPYTIGGVGADYPAISAAFADAVVQGVSGPVDFRVNDGTWTDNLNVDMAAIAGLSATNTITLRSAGNDSSLVTVQSAVPSVDVTLWAFGNMRHLRVQDITWKHTGASGVEFFRTNGDMIDVQFLRNHFIAWPGGNDFPIDVPYGPVVDVVVEHNTFENAESSVVLSTVLGSKASHNVSVSHNHFTGGWPVVAIWWTVGLEVDSNTFHEVTSAIVVSKCDSVTVRWNDLEISGTAIQVYGTDMSPANNCTDVLVAENTIAGNGIDVSGIGMNSVVRPVVNDNAMNGTGGYGITLIYLDDPVVRENVIDSAYGIGIQLYNFSGGALVEDNTVVMDSAWFYNQGLVMDTQLDPGSVVRITGNRLHSVDSGLGMELLGLIGDATNRALVANNEVIGFSNAAEFESTSSDIVFNSFLVGASSTYPVALDLSTDLLFSNNVVSVPDGVPAAYVVQAGGAAPALNHNIYHYDNANLWLTDSYTDLTAANSDGQESGSLLLDPEFIDPALSLQPGNAAMLNTGVPFASVTTDIMGFPRNTASPTPGAYEDIAMALAPFTYATNMVSLWPSPFTDVLHLDAAALTGPMTVEFIATDGRCMLRFTNVRVPATINGLETLPSGIYTVRCSSGTQVLTARCVKP